MLCFFFFFPVVVLSDWMIWWSSSPAITQPQRRTLVHPLPMRVGPTASLSSSIQDCSTQMRYATLAWFLTKKRGAISKWEAWESTVDRRISRPTYPGAWVIRSICGLHNYWHKEGCFEQKTMPATCTTLLPVCMNQV